MALHDEFVQTKWDLQCNFGFTTVPRRFSKLGSPDAICAPASFKQCSKRNSNIIDFKDLSVFGRARLLGIGNEEDDDTDDDESTHHSSTCHRLKYRILTVRRRKKHIRTSNVGSHEVEGDSRETEAVEEIAKQVSRSRRIGFRPKDEVITITSYDRPDGSSEWSPSLKPHVPGALVRYVGKRLYDIVVTIKSVYKGVRPSYKRKNDSTLVVSSSGTDEGIGDKAPSPCDAPLLEKPPVRSDILQAYHDARTKGLPEISRKN